MEKTIVWDWNGTLFNDVDLCIESINRLLSAQNLPIFPNKEAYQRIFCFPIIRYYTLAGFDFHKRSFEQLADDYMEYYQPRSYACTLYEHVISTLKYFQKKGYRQILLSASKQDFLEKQMQCFSIDHYFEVVLALDNIHAFSKQDIALRYFQQHPHENITLIGDSVHDYEVAQSLNADCILIADGHEHISKLRQTQAIVIDTMAKLTDVFQ